jgi:hypothetical protein
LPRLAENYSFWPGTSQAEKPRENRGPFGSIGEGFLARGAEST